MMETSKLKCGDVLTTLKGYKWKTTTDFSSSRGIGMKNLATGEKQTLFQETLSMVWAKVERPQADGTTIQIWPALEEVSA